MLSINFSAYLLGLRDIYTLLKRVFLPKHSILIANFGSTLFQQTQCQQFHIIFHSLAMKLRSTDENTVPPQYSGIKYLIYYNLFIFEGHINFYFHNQAQFLRLRKT